MNIKSILFYIMVTLALLTPNIISTPAEANQYVFKPDVRVEKLVTFIQKQNKSMDNKTAYQLANSIVEAEIEYKIPREITLAIIKRESNFKKYALGKAGELGFAQIMNRVHSDRVYRMYQSGEIVSFNIYDPHTNIILGASILSDCLKLKRNNMSKALSCYNGSRTVGEYSVAVISSAKKIKSLV